MTLNVHQHFVDRGPERALFADMLSGRHPARVLRVLVAAGHGKSWLVKRLFFDCEERSVPVVWLDFDVRQHARPADARYVIERFLEQLGEARLPHTAALTAEWRRAVPSPETDDRFLPALGRTLRDDLARWTDAPAAATDEFTFHERGVTALLERLGKTHPRYLEAVAYQTRLLPENITVARLYGDTPELKAERNRTLTQLNRLTLEVWGIAFDAFCAAPAGAPAAAATQPPLAILLDTFEQIPDATRDWLSGWLFDSLRRELARVRVVVAGRPEPACCAFFERADLWGDLVTSIDRFEPMPEDAVLEYYRRRGCVFGDLHPATICHLARTNAGRMASIGDGLPRAGGA